MIKVGWKISLLNNFHNREIFDCDDIALNDYLKYQANQHMKSNISQTYVASSIATGNRILGYYSICVGSVEYCSLPNNIQKKLPKYPIPIARIARLAVDIGSQKTGLGRYLLMNALERFKDISQIIGIFAVVVDAKHEKAKNFYCKHGFIELPSSPLTLLLPLKNINASFYH